MRVGVAVERVLAQGSGERGAGAALHGPHRLGDLGGAFVVENAEVGGGLPVRDPLVIGELVGHEGALDDRVVGIGSAVGRAFVGQVRDHEQLVAEPGRDLVVFAVERLLVLAEFAAARLECFRFVDLAVAAHHPDVFRDRLHLGTECVAFGDDLADAGVEIARPLERHQDGLVTAAGQRRPRGVEIVPDEAYVDHVATG